MIALSDLPKPSGERRDRTTGPRADPCEGVATPIQPGDSRPPGQGPGFYPNPHPETLSPGLWIIHVPGGSAFALNAVGALSRAAVERAPGPSREVFERIRDAFIAASPDYGE